MKKALLFFLIFLLIFSLILPCAAKEESYSWYCVHVKDHRQPTVASELAFAERYGGYFLDRRVSAEAVSDKVVYLTFDAGYENGNVAKILDVLAEKQVPAAFFILGNLITRNTDLVLRMGEEGHTVCNHTVRHKDMSRADGETLLSELRELEDLYREKTGKELSHYYRPPEGRFSADNLKILSENGYKTIFWSFAYPDWNNEKQMPCEAATRVILENVHNGEVMLLHPTSATNAAVLGDVITALRAEGYRFGTLDELTGAV